jgi:protein-L-isoaspartate(D-aspartate) O-methyltransferase
MDVAGADGPNIARLHQALVNCQVREGNISSPAVEAAFRAVPRHLFLPGMPPEVVYSDQAIMTKYLDGTHIPISSSSQPAIMAIMLEQLELKPGQRVLEIGAGTGYNAALIASIVGEKGLVVSVDIDDDTVASARAHLETAGCRWVRVLCADGAQGYLGAAPYDRIILSVGSADILPAWREQLRPGGRLVLPLSIRGTQLSVAFEQAGDHLRSLSLHSCRFMMLRGAFSGDGLRTQIGPEPLINLESSERHSIDTDVVYRWLTQGGRDTPLDLALTSQDMFFQLSTWLALHEPDHCRLTIDAAMAGRSILSAAAPADSARKYISTTGLLGEGGLCVLIYQPEQPALFNRQRSPSWFVRSFGPDAAPAGRLLAQAHAWDGAGRSALERLSIKAYPQTGVYSPLAGEPVISRQWTRLVCTWK